MSQMINTSAGTRPRPTGGRPLLSSSKKPAAEKNAATQSTNASATVSSAPLVPSVPGSQVKTPGILRIDSGSEQLHSGENLANTKDKTPMCLINELARYQKVEHKYTLTDEQGPAHKKVFFVKLNLGSEEYSASGPSIKKAQHAAAAIALEQTKFSRPPHRAPRPNAHRQTPKVVDADNKSLTPTVELNSLVMKRNLVAEYQSLEVPSHQQRRPVDHYGVQTYNNYYPRVPRIFRVELTIGSMTFVGEANTRQNARHDAAAKALAELQKIPSESSPKESQDGEDKDDSINKSTDEGGEEAIKSEISLVYEIALKRGLGVVFNVVRESGPPHLKNFVTECVCGNITVQGEGNSKKTSKKQAADLMLVKLKELPPLPQSLMKPKKQAQNKKKNKNLIKAQKASPEYGSLINPISRLMQIQQAKKGKEPDYRLVIERGPPKRREFVIEVKVNDHVAQGVGPNKKLAKRNASEKMLELMGCTKPTPQPSKPAIRTDSHAASEKKVHFSDQDGAQAAGAQAAPMRQVMPGVILMPVEKVEGYAVQGAVLPNRKNVVGNHSPETITTIAQELLKGYFSPTAEAIRQRAQPGTIVRQMTRPSEMLFYMGEVLGFSVQFTDFPQGSAGEFLSLVSLATVPPQVSTGSGPTREVAHDSASHSALCALAMLENPARVVPAEVKVERVDHRGDGAHVPLREA